MNELCSATAIIPARGGSRGVPRKNVLMLAGKPMIGWTIEAAMNAETIEHVVVSTDSPEIAETADRFGAGVVWRPAEISGDLAASEDALLHAITTMADEGRPTSDITVFLQCTAPLMVSEDIDGTVSALVQNLAETALAVADFHYFLWKESGQNDLVGINHDKKIRQLRQERETNYIETGAIYVMRTQGFLQHRHRFFGKTAHYLMPPERVLEIDEPVDYRVAEVLLQERMKLSKSAALPARIGLIVFDFDGVFTDDRVLVSEDGTESVSCSRSDGMGVRLAREAGHKMLVLSTERNPVVRQRAQKLELEVIQGTDRKAAVLSEYLTNHNIDWADVVYLGNDVNDLDCLKRAGCGVVVADANPTAVSAANIVLSRNGGQHAIRELIDLILSSRRSDT